MANDTHYNMGIGNMPNARGVEPSIGRLPGQTMEGSLSRSTSPHDPIVARAGRRDEVPVRLHPPLSLSLMMQCAICGHTIKIESEAFVPTTTGEYVHIACADKQARATHLIRTMLAFTSAGLFTLLILRASFVGMADVGIVVLLVALVVLHIFLHRLWWRLIIGAARLWWCRWMRM